MAIDPGLEPGAQGSTFDISAVQDAAEAFRNLDEMARRAGGAMTAAFTSGMAGGKSLDQVLANLGARLSNIALNAALKPLEGALGSGLEALVKSLGAGVGGVTASARGNVFSGGRVQPFARGGVVAAPTYFPMSGGVGLMGEQGAEAIMPLKRGADGRLGVQAAGGGAVNVTVNIAARDVESFRASRAQVSAAVARAVARGQRAM
ncbi:phage tail tape measure protein [Camelimonas sp. ID_303_24]